MERVLQPRSLLEIRGDDAASFLQGLITNDMGMLQTQPAIYAAMLSPQGKWQHDFFIFRKDSATTRLVAPRAEGGDFYYYIDHASVQSAALLKKLTLYRLRSRVELQLRDDVKFSLSSDAALSDASFSFADPRHAHMPHRAWRHCEQREAIQMDRHVADAPRDDDAYYHTQRVALGIPEGGTDITENDTALDVGLDLLHGVSFTKGCYVGQEITARMHYKSIARKGFVRVQYATPLTETDITFAGKKIAELRSTHGNFGLAYGRLEDWLPALSSSEPALCGSVQVQLSTPDWQRAKIEKFTKNEAASEGAAEG